MQCTCPGHDVKLHPSSAVRNQQRPCAGPKPGQRRKVCQMGGDTLAVTFQDDRNPQIHDTSDIVAQLLQDVTMWSRYICTGQTGQTDREVGGENLGHIRVNATQVVLHASLPTFSSSSFKMLMVRSRPTDLNCGGWVT